MTAADTTGSDKTITLPNVTGTIVLGTGSQNYLSKWTGTNSVTAGLIYDDGTYIGIGTTAPATKLEVVGEIRGTRFAFQDDTNTYIDTIGADKIAIAAGGTNWFVVNDGGVGIGTTDPSTLLEIQQNGNGSQLMISGSSDPDKNLAIGYDTINNFSKLQSKDGVGSFTYLLLNPEGGNVGIGTTLPVQELQVAGDVYTSGGLYVGANNTNNLISNATAGSGSTTLYIGNESILASGDIGVSVQGYNGGLQSISGLTEAADQMLYTTASNTYALTGLTAFGRSLIDDVDDAAARATLNLEIGTDVQAWDTGLDDVSGLSPVDSTFIVGNGTNWVAETGNTARTSLGLGTGDSPTFTDLTLSSLVTDGVLYSTSGNINSEANLSVTRGGTGVGTLTDGGILLGSGTGAITVTAQPTNGQLLIGSGGADPVLANLTGTLNQVNVTNGAGSITLSLPQSIATTSAVTFATLDTGQGANELYDMDQNVLTTSNVTFGSGTISNDLTVDTDTLYVDSADNRVGIGTTDPQYKLDVNGDVRVASGSDFYVNAIGLNDNASVSSGSSLIGLY